MTPLDPVSADLASRTGLPYDDVHDALAVLASCGWAHAHAVRFVEQQAENGVGTIFGNVADLARATVQASSRVQLSTIDRCAGGHLVKLGSSTCHVCGEPIG